MRIDKKIIALIKGVLGLIEIAGSIYISYYLKNPYYLIPGIVLFVITVAILSYLTEPETNEVPETIIEIIAEKSEESGRKTQENEELKMELEKYQKLAKILNLLVEDGKIPVWQIYQIWENTLKHRDTYMIFEMGDAFPLSKALDESRKKREIKFSKEARRLIVNSLRNKGFIATRSMFSNFVTSKMKAIRLFSDRALRMVPLYVIKIPKNVITSENEVKQVIVDGYMEYAHKTKRILIEELRKISSKLEDNDKENMEKLISTIELWHPTGSVLLVMPLDTMPVVLGSDKVSPEALFLLAGNERNLEKLKEYLKETIFPYLTISIYGKYADLYIAKIRKLEQQENELLNQLNISSWSELPVLWEKDPNTCISVLSTADLIPGEIEKLVGAIREIQDVLS
ncbi:hypothetical protein [Thermococcus aciditolerans]|uniref:Uncharacterized protein n=1 Tax=Thermococcus aciditolerans TaxID=2598455 RepID=A0A5C0SMS4_9EURY|nr:hypothetical protein [Thermococcus aciditolerans]QEK15272.1 hypothetical protein FPV09_09385 [Thermococcus aciditolerans]